MEYYESIKTGVEIRRMLTSCNDVELASFMAKLTELLINSEQKSLIYKFIVNLSNNQNYEMLKKIESILPTNCLIQDSITISKNVSIFNSSSAKIVNPSNSSQQQTCCNNNNNNNNDRGKRHRNRRKKKKK